jgi:hypothetical protein
LLPSISLGIDDLLTISSKGWLAHDAEQQSSILEKLDSNSGIRSHIVSNTSRTLNNLSGDLLP